MKKSFATHLSGNKTEPALIESFTHAALSRKAFTAQPYKNLVVCNCKYEQKRSQQRAKNDVQRT